VSFDQVAVAASNEAAANSGGGAKAAQALLLLLERAASDAAKHRTLHTDSKAFAALAALDGAADLIAAAGFQVRRSCHSSVAVLRPFPSPFLTAPLP
jgi:hypothetical protein